MDAHCYFVLYRQLHRMVLSSDSIEMIISNFVEKSLKLPLRTFYERAHPHRRAS